MDRPAATGNRRPRLGLWPLIPAVFVFVSAIVVEGCGTTHPAGTSMVASMPSMAPSVTTPAAASAPTAMGSDIPTTVDLTSAWASRPAFVTADPATEDAYSYAFHNPQVIQWMPCYCGCARMDHRSNLDCYLKRGPAGQTAQFEEHASYCDVCVKITRLSKELVAQGKSLREIRQAVDQTFGGQVEGTPTELPPA